MRYLSYVLILIPIFITAQERKGIITGRVFNKETKEPLAYCSIISESKQAFAHTDQSGMFSVQLPYGSHKLAFSFIGYTTITKEILITAKKENQYLTIELVPSSIVENEILVQGRRNTTSTTVQEIGYKDLAKIPNMYSDVLRSVQILSGVSSNNELSSGYNVRGGTFEENLIYLNGYEIYRPFLLRQGVEENQSLINTEMVSEMQFYNGGFSAKYGDKMSSALEVKYLTEKSEKISGILRADLMNMGLSLKGTLDKLNWKTGFRLAYPAMFLQKLQTRGDYKPSFSDIQLLGNYSFSTDDQIEVFFLYSVNKYDMSPREWIGNFQSSRVDIHQVTIDQSGDKYYSFNTNLAALKYLKTMSNSLSLIVSISKYFSKENEKSDVIGNIFYSPDAANPEAEKEFLFTRIENIDNHSSLSTFNLQTEIKIKFEDHSLTGGLDYKDVYLTSNKNEYYIEDGTQAVQITPLTQFADNQYQLNSYALFIEDDYSLSTHFKLNAGIRFSNYRFTRENLFSPRVRMLFILNDNNSFSFKTGVYYQPPFFTELTGLVDNADKLKSQQAIHFSLGWNHQLRDKVTLSWEIFYKKLNKLIPFYYEDLKLIPVKGNVDEGYSVGFDLMFQGEISNGIESWLGYSYLNSKEREMNSGKPYRRRLLDQTHTFQIFLQDHFRRFPNWQSHLRLLAGSGFLYNYRRLIKDEKTGQYVTDVVLDNPEVYTLYLRADMGLSAAFNLSEKSKLIFFAEVLNVFNQYNYGGFDWIRVFNNSQGLINVPKILSKRFFNFKVEFYF